ncbi:MerR family transcriptional regulator [Nocardiopsis sp. RSe5-2]|uniref:MerR family transcriptional regulator n=1 Tax=Nocardiopsis endophytica TaxID=3018445 RepID=A0ABT4TXD1_9ACTN|nr:MerR family transcriptional regulator [Nocardiopsis endophytica]MDA2809355.1 MerR family transcriptional regulator [Nocardiopsis endophytica]
MREERPRSDQGVYTISVAAALVGLPAATLRQYEEKGLVEPARTEGRTRLYSDEDIARLRRIAELSAQGVNMVGIGRILALQEENARLRRSARAAGDDPAPPKDTPP